MAVKYGSLPFDAQIAFFRQKLALPTRAWTDVLQANHDHAFVVAGANTMALVEDMQTATQKAIEQGATIAEFRKDFDQAVVKHGWDYKGSRGWRTRVIYETNIRSSYQAGRFEQLQAMPFWKYHHSPASENARPEHQAWDGLTLPKDDPFWQTHYPMNGWGCKCSVTGFSKQRMRAKGLKPSISPKLEFKQQEFAQHGRIKVYKGVSPGFAYAPGRSSWMHNHVPRLDDALPHGFDKPIPATPAGDLLPDPRPYAKDKLLPPMRPGEEDKYAELFLKQFNATIAKPVLFTDAAGEAVAISDALFKDFNGDWKIGKRGRSADLNMLAASLKSPDEIWTWMEWHSNEGKASVSRAYVTRYDVDGKTWLSLVVMNRRKGTWSGVTTHTSRSAGEFNKKVSRNRQGIRLYKRPEQ